MPSLKKKQSAVLVAKKKRAKVVEKLNPFEVRINKKKHDVLGQKSKSDKGLPGVARSKAVKKRKTTLLVEYRQRNKSNQFVDRRFGEYDDQLTAEEKMLKRFTLERKRKHERSSLFNLSDDDGEGLTHYGQSIGDMERFDHIELSGDEMEDEDIGSTHFGGVLRKKQKLSDTGELDKPEKQRSRKEIMQEVVAKSKEMKYKQQSEKQNVEELLEKINTDWKAVKTSLPFAGEEVKAQRSQNDDYDLVVRELAFERRGQPTNRMKTEEEIAKEEKEKLEKLEANRIRRMKGVVSSSDEVIRESADYVREISALSKKKVQFAIRYKDGKIVTEDNDVGVVSEESGICDHNEEHDDISEASDTSEDSVDSDSCDPANEYGSDLESDISDQESNEEGEEVVQSKHSQAQIKKMKELASKELPFTFPVPKTLDELQAIVDNRSPEECLTAVERIHSCNHPSIDPGNKKKLQEFLSIFLDYCTSLGEVQSRESLETLNKLARPLFKLCQLSSLATAQLFQNKLQFCHHSWIQAGGRRYPPLSQLLFLKLVSVVFPTSDFEHPITTPALLLMGQLLAKCAVKCLNDLVSGLLVSQWVLEYLSQSKRFMPELVNFLTSVLGYFAADQAGIRFPPLTGKLSNKINLFKFKDDSSIPTLLTLAVDIGASNAGCCVLKNTLSAVSSLVELYSNLPSFSELVAPLITNLKSTMKRNWPSAIEDVLSETLEQVCSKGSKDKSVLQLLKQKPKSIRFYEPKFDEVYEVSRKKARSKSMGEQQKLKHKVKKETKGAIREIRKDASFLAKEKLSEQKKLDAERAAKTKKILHDLQMGQFEVKQERRKKRN